jgi:hypothetical protein
MRQGHDMTPRDLIGMIVTGLLLGLVVIAVMRQPVLDDAANEKAQRLAEAKMKARLFTKFPDPAIAQMSVPLRSDAK